MCPKSKMRGASRRILRLPAAVVLAIGLLMVAGGDACADGAAAPSVTSEAVSHITQTGATLEAQIAPGSNPAGVYHQFQVAHDFGEYPSEIVCPPEPAGGPARPCIGAHSPDALPIGFLASGAGPDAVELELAGAGVTLMPGTTYHYRVLVAEAVQTEDTIEWESPAIIGPDQTFTTAPAQPSDPGPRGDIGAGAGPPAEVSPLRHRHRRHHRKHRRRASHLENVHRASPAG